MPGVLLGAPYCNFFSSHNTCDVSTTIILVSEMRRQWHRKVKEVAQGSTASQWQRQGWNSSQNVLESMLCVLYLLHKSWQVCQGSSIVTAGTVRALESAAVNKHTANFSTQLSNLILHSVAFLSLR